MAYKFRKDVAIEATANSKRFLVVLANLVKKVGAPSTSSITPADVAKAAKIELASAAGVMTPLYKLGLIARVKKGTTRFLQLTAAGWRLMEPVGAGAGSTKLNAHDMAEKAAKIKRSTAKPKLNAHDAAEQAEAAKR
jgi:predicted transcriptional regulator